jgi:hypothetical protein
MGRICASLLLLLGACGVDGDVEGLPPGPTDDIQPGGVGDIVPRYVPQVCGVSSWSPDVAGGAMHVSVAQRPGGGATILAAPHDGGQVVGFNTDFRMNLDGTGTKVPLGNSSSFVRAAYMMDRPVSATVDDGAVYVHLLDYDLQTAQYVTRLPGNYLGEQTFYLAQGNIVMPVVGDDGLWMHRFDDSLEPIDAKHFKLSAAGRSISVAQMGTSLMTAWATDTSCHMMINSTYEPGVSTMVNTPCSNPRLAINQKTGNGVMLFDSAEGVRLLAIDNTAMSGTTIIRADSHSPRALFDGTNTWISYLDMRGDVIVGFLDAQHRPVTMSLGAPQPDRHGYELVWLNNAPWVFSVDDSGYTAYRMCVGTR